MSQALEASRPEPAKPRGPRRVLSLAQAAERVNLSYEFFRGMVKRGEACRFFLLTPNRWVAFEDEFEAWLEARAAATPDFITSRKPTKSTVAARAARAAKRVSAPPRRARGRPRREPAVLQDA